MLKWIIGLSIAAGAFLVIQQVESCNEAVCGSVVSKCLLTKSCNCDLKNCTCCKDCFNCLSYLYSECCSCVDMCPKPNDTGTVLSRKSHVEDFDGVPALFSVLTESPDVMKRWDTKTFPVDIEYNHYGVKKQFKIKMQTAEQEVIPTIPDVITLNCTVAFWAQCMSWTKCRTSCQSMGASSYRWFHDGCCECIGEYCINYGINESRCTACWQGSEESTKIDEDDYDYGELEDEDIDE
ncbi:unnamed protein product [Phaedon cochleariae]|uniref:Protein twisted gastrulation n=1 Tax=Phaedon cochleariae TaxID=80249 RepID=A0A9N9X3T8_PHACE|nr:unnamed protein product [Phaedon cochleariae]